MEHCYHEDVVLFFSTQNLEEIVNLFKNAKDLKGCIHKILTFSNSSELCFNSRDYLVCTGYNDGEGKNDTLPLRSKREEECSKDERNIQTDEKNSKGDRISAQINGKNINTLGEQREDGKNEMTKSCSSNDKDMAKVGIGKEKGNSSLFSEKCLNDEHELISKEIFNSLYKNKPNAKFSKKYKLFTEIIIQAIMYGNKINLSIHKLNLFISIIIMTMHEIKENMKRKKKKRKTINYFINLLKKNTQYCVHSEKTLLSSNLEEVNPAHVGDTNVEEITQKNKKTEDDGIIIWEQKNVQGSIKRGTEKQMNSKGDDNISKNEKGINDKNVKTKITGDTDSSIQIGEHKNSILDDNNVPISDVSCTDKCIEKSIILFQYDEAKYIVKYIFENIFSIYNVLEYLFLYPPHSVKLSFSNNFAVISPTMSFSTKDQLKNDKESMYDDEFAAKSFVKEAQDVPLFVVDMFYNHVNQLKEKIDTILE
ncbi:conserved Plasmodium protein, unknown function [Plasmodium ovale]|uniref:Uncharacterized protein n=1 Tax=Plasmodium ovale TaxID=36330 RepID=A0A1D3TG02_PLAOA|nr:conserved Plasmodium protein, unknown function [Plasmodium ovale]